MEKNIFLIGFMGSGKSTVAKALEKITHGRIIEMDSEIVQKEGMEISRIFAEHGEGYFRKLESELLRNVKNSQGNIVSCGGGVPMKEENVAIMRDCGITVLLEASPETILSRVRDNEDRPLLQDKKNVEAIADLMNQRREKYEKCADIRIDTNDKSADEIAREILTCINL